MPKCAIPDLPVFREAALSRSASVNDLRQGLQMKDDEGDRKVSKVSGSAAAVLGARNREKRIFETVPWQPSSRRSIVKQFRQVDHSIGVLEAMRTLQTAFGPVGRGPSL